MYGRWFPRSLVVTTAAITIRLAIATSAQTPSTVPTFTRDIAPILWSRCSECHRPNGVAPFSLLTYANARQRAQQIAEVVANGTMPPWMPDASVRRTARRCDSIPPTRAHGAASPKRCT